MRWILGLCLLAASVCLLHQRRRCQRPPVHRFSHPTQPGPRWLFLGTVHGNEPAGGIALSVLVRCLRDGRLPFLRGQLTVIPVANPCGLQQRMRWSPGEEGVAIDRNRIYHGSVPEGAFGQYVWHVEGGLRQAEGVLDLHEGWGYHALQPESIGSTVQAVGEPVRTWALELVRGLNERLPPSAAAPYRFLPTREPIPGSLHDWCRSHGRRSVLAETSGQEDLQPLPVRAAQHLYVAWELGRRLGFWSVPVPDRATLERWCQRST